MSFQAEIKSHSVFFEQHVGAVPAGVAAGARPCGGAARIVEQQQDRLHSSLLLLQGVQSQH